MTMDELSYSVLYVLYDRLDVGVRNTELSPQVRHETSTYYIFTYLIGVAEDWTSMKE